MFWALLCISVLALSAVATALLVYKLCRDCDVRASTVQWLFVMFFLLQSVGATTRLIYFIWLTIYAEASLEQHDGFDGPALIGTELYRLGTSAVLNLGTRQNGWITATIIVGDTALFGITIWLFLLVYEISKLVALSMDRGDHYERAKIQLYAWSGYATILLFLVVEITLAILSSGYSTTAYVLLLSVYVFQTIGLGYMMVTVLVLKVTGRDYESVHGRFVTSPLYRRLKWIMWVYAVLVFQFYLTSIVMYATPDHVTRLSRYASVSFVVYYMRGLVLSVVTGCSQVCVVRYLHGCVPEDVYATILHDRTASTVAIGTELPYTHPVFVYTDIEASSALWAWEDGHVMQEATRIHDDILRGLLAPSHGYEITTAGDSFQLAFHSISEAIEYCLSAQLALVRAKWPKQLHGLVPATTKVRVGTKVLFRGLRVRMGIHDAVSSEGSLVRDVHVVTKKLIYTGASEVIAKEVGDLGAGGQILVTQRIAEWLGAHANHLAIPCIVQPVCKYTIARLPTTLDVFQVAPKALAARLGSFYLPRRQGERDKEETLLEEEKQGDEAYVLVQTPRGDRGGLDECCEEV